MHDVASLDESDGRRNGPRLFVPVGELSNGLFDFAVGTISADGFSTMNTTEEQCAGGTAGGLIRLRGEKVGDERNGECLFCISNAPVAIVSSLHFRAAHQVSNCSLFS